MLPPKRVVRDHRSRGLVKGFRIGNSLDASKLDRRHLSKNESYEFIIRQVSLHKGNSCLKAERSKHFYVADKLIVLSKSLPQQKLQILMRDRNYLTVSLTECQSWETLPPHLPRCTPTDHSYDDHSICFESTPGSTNNSSYEIRGFYYETTKPVS